MNLLRNETGRDWYHDYRTPDPEVQGQGRVPLGDVPSQWLQGFPSGSGDWYDVRLSTMRGGAALMQYGTGFEVRTNAPYAAVGPTHALNFKRVEAASPGTTQASAVYWFYVPHDIATIPLEIEARFDCVPGVDCPTATQRHDIGYQPAALWLLDEQAAIACSLHVDSGNLGRADTVFCVEERRGQLWGIQARMYGSGPHLRDGRICSINVGDSIPGYFSWKGPSRLRVPVVAPVGSNYRVTDWSLFYSYLLLTPPVAALAGVAPQVGDLKRPDLGPPSSGLLPVVLSGPGSYPGAKRWVSAHLQRWSLGAGQPDTAQALRTSRTPFYLVAPAQGMAEDGRLKSFSWADTMYKPGSPIVMLKDAVPRDSCAPWVDSCTVYLEQAEAKGFQTYEVTSMTGDPPGSLGIDRIVELKNQFIFTQLDNPFPTAEHWNAFLTRMAYTREKPGVVAIQVGDENLDKACQTPVVIEALFQGRLMNPRHPLIVQETGSRQHLGLLSDAADIWLDDHFPTRPTGKPSPTPICEVVYKLLDVQRGSRPYRGAGMQHQVGYRENGAYCTLHPDSVACMSLAALALGASDVTHFLRFSRDDSTGVIYDLAVENPGLWAAYGPDGMIAALHRTAEMLEDAPTYGVRLLPEGWYGAGCPIPPVVCRFGWWNPPCPPDCSTVGRYVVLANLDQDLAHEVSLDWGGDLQIPSEAEVTAALDWGSRGVTEDNIEVFPGQDLRFSVPSTGYLVARVYWFGGATAGAALTGGPASPLAIRLLGNPAPGQCTLQLSGRGAESARIEIFDVAGRLQRTLRPGEEGREPGMVIWDRRTTAGKRCPAGVYFVRATNGPRERATATVVAFR